ncbi:rhodopsin-like [Lytechinus pictus]|uniref:rhodopsin-like n=1 Tax=Lytechinus pictus TaxID=7653 RepID=UPI0030BA1F2B
MTPNVTDNATVQHRFMHDLGSPAQIAEILTLSVILIVALSANIVAFTTIVQDRKLRSNPHNLLVLNLIVMDLGIAVLSMTFSMISIFDGGRLLEAFPILCKINGFGASMCTIGNFATVLFISTDRLMAVVWSARYPSSRKRVTVMIVIIWIISLLVGIAPLTGEILLLLIHQTMYGILRLS